MHFLLSIKQSHAFPAHKFFANWALQRDTSAIFPNKLIAVSAMPNDIIFDQIPIFNLNNIQKLLTIIKSYMGLVDWILLSLIFKNANLILTLITSKNTFSFRSVHIIHITIINRLKNLLTTRSYAMPIPLFIANEKRLNWLLCQFLKLLYTKNILQVW